MKDRYRLICRPNGYYYKEDADSVHRKRTSLKTQCEVQARRLLQAANEAERDPRLARAVAKAYINAGHPEATTATWALIGRRVEDRYEGSTRVRWQKFLKMKGIQSLLRKKLIETYLSDFEEIFNDQRTGVSAYRHLQTLQSYAVNSGLLLEKIVQRGQWPKYHAKKKKPITRQDHERILQQEQMEEYRRYYRLLWETGCSQSDAANLSRDNVFEAESRIRFRRMKLRNRESRGGTCIPIGPRIREILDSCPPTGYLFPHLQKMREDTRATHFRKVSTRAGVTGVSLHCYRYGWACRAKKFGMPMREAMSHLGHSSIAIHEAYASEICGYSKPLEEYEALYAS